MRKCEHCGDYFNVSNYGKFCDEYCESMTEVDRLETERLRRKAQVTNPTTNKE